MFFLVSYFFQSFLKACVPSPNLNKAFVMGPGYAPITYKLVTKITAGLFLDLAGLLPSDKFICTYLGKANHISLI